MRRYHKKKVLSVALRLHGGETLDPGRKARALRGVCARVCVCVCVYSRVGRNFVVDGL